MRKDIQRALPILAALACGCKAELPMQLAQDASPSFPCTSFADYLVAFNPAGTEGGSPLGSKTLGPPDNDTISLTANSTLTVAFLGLGGIVDQAGGDIQVHGSVQVQVAVYLGADESQLRFSGSLGPGELTVDMSTASAETTSYIRLVGISGDATIDAFEALQTVCTN